MTFRTMRLALRSIAIITALTAGGIAQGRPLPVIDALGDAPVAATSAAKAKAVSRPNRFVSAHVDERLDVPTFLWIDASAKGTPAKAFAAMSPEAAARAHLKGFAELYRITAAEVDAAPLHHVDTLANGAKIAKFTSRREGIEVFRESAAVLMDATGQALAVGGFIGSTQTLAPLAAATRVNGGNGGNFTLTPSAAVAIAMGDYAFPPAIANEFIRHVPARDAAAHAAEGYEHFTLPNLRASADGSRLTAPARTKRVWFRLPQGLVPAYYVELQMHDARHDSHDAYSYVISADDGRLLFRNNLTADAAFTYKAWAEPGGINLPYPGPEGRNATPHPTGLNDGFQPAFVPQNDITLQNGPLSTNDPWLAPGATRTIGNNVEAWANHTGAPLVPPATVISDGVFDADPNECDLLAPQVGDFHACVSSPGNFSYVFDPAVGAGANKTQVMAAVTQLFYTTNWLHDWYYDAGFREIDGNAQADNYGRGGLGNDSMRAQAQDYSGTNNANMSTPADGARPRMRMYIFTATGNAIFTVSSPLGISGNYPVTTALFGPQSFDLINPVPLVQAIDPADAAGALTTDGCSAFTNAAAIAGNIAVIDRGTCTFVTKVKNAQNAGAVGVLIANSATGTFSGMAGTDATITIPVLMITNAAGATIKSQLTSNGGPGVTGNLRRVSGVDRDGTIDNGVVAHEWGHYISNRLISNANGLTTNMSGGLGEGWADFHALLMMVKPEDALVPSNTAFNGTYAVGGYVSDGPQIAGATQSAAHYYGFRRYPYSTDFAKNPLTFKHIQNGAAFALPASPPPAFSDFNNNAEVHSTGEVWATMLWGCYASLLRDTGRLTFAQAQDRMKRYLVAGYKLTPINPTLVEARDALFAAMAAQDPADVALCMSAFAQRGAGLRAAFTGDRYTGTNVGVVESFTAGNDMQVASISLDARSGLYCDADPFLDNGETGTLTVTIRNTGAGTLSGTTVSISGAGLTFPSGSSANVPAIAPFATGSATFTVGLSGAANISTATITATATDPSLAIPGPVSASLALRVQRDRALAVSASDDVEDPVTVWTPSLAAGTTDAALNWTRVAVSGTDHHWNAPSGDSAGVAWLTSPPLAVSATGPFNMSFRHRFAFEFDSSGNYDGGVIEISDNGGATWVDVNTVVPGVYGGTTITTYTGTLNPLAGRPGFARESAGNPAYNTATIAFPATYFGKTVLVRFGVGTDADGHLTGWDIDDIAFTGITNTPFPGYVNDPQSCVSASATGGTPQTSALNTTFVAPLQLRVLGAGAQPVPGAPVTFQAPGSGASGTFTGGVSVANVVTDVGGFATAPVFTANGTAGAYNVVANAGVSTVNFALTNGVLSSVALVSVASRKIHGPAGTFNIPIDSAPPVTGPISVEPRAIGAGHTIVFHFDGLIGDPGSAAAVDPVPGPAVGATPVASGNDVLVTLTGVPDNHRLTITLTGVNGSASAAASIGFLVGDANGTRSVTPADIQQVKARSGQVTDVTNFRFDVNASGVITAADIVTVKQRSGLSLP